jgi:hypothetical protein
MKTKAKNNTFGDSMDGGVMPWNRKRVPAKTFGTTQQSSESLPKVIVNSDIKHDPMTRVEGEPNIKIMKAVNNTGNVLPKHFERSNAEGREAAKRDARIGIKQPKDLTSAEWENVSTAKIKKPLIQEGTPLSDAEKVKQKSFIPEKQPLYLPRTNYMQNSTQVEKPLIQEGTPRSDAEKVKQKSFIPEKQPLYLPRTNYMQNSTQVEKPLIQEGTPRSNTVEKSKNEKLSEEYPNSDTPTAQILLTRKQRRLTNIIPSAQTSTRAKVVSRNAQRNNTPASTTPPRSGSQSTGQPQGKTSVQTNANESQSKETTSTQTNANQSQSKGTTSAQSNASQNQPQGKTSAQTNANESQSKGTTAAQSNASQNQPQGSTVAARTANQQDKPNQALAPTINSRNEENILNPPREVIIKIKYENPELETQIENLQKQIRKKENSIEAEKETYNSEISKLGNEIEKLNQSLNRIRGERNEAKTELQAAKADITTKDSTINSLNGKIAELEKQIETKNNDITKLEKKIKSLKTRQDYMNTHIKTYNELYTKLTRDSDNIYLVRNMLKSEIEKLDIEIEKLEELMKPKPNQPAQSGGDFVTEQENEQADNYRTRMEYLQVQKADLQLFLNLLNGIIEGIELKYDREEGEPASVYLARRLQSKIDMFESQNKKLDYRSDRLREEIDRNVKEKIVLEAKKQNKNLQSGNKLFFTKSVESIQNKINSKQKIIGDYENEIKKIQEIKNGNLLRIGRIKGRLDNVGTELKAIEARQRADAEDPNGINAETKKKIDDQVKVATGSKDTKIVQLTEELRLKEAALLEKEQKLKDAQSKVGVPEKSFGLQELFKAKPPEKDLKRIEQYTKELLQFFGYLKTFSLGAGGLLNSLQNQMNTRKLSLSNKGISASKKKYTYMSMVNAGKMCLSSYMRRNIDFLVDEGFRKKIDYLLTFDEQNYINLMNKFKLECHEQFFNKLESIVSQSVVPDAFTDDPDEVNAAKEKFLEKVFKSKEKLYALYYNKISLMDLFNRSFFVIYFLKGLRLFFIWFSLYLASKIFQSQYVSKVFANNLDPPDLKRFILIFWALETAFMVFLIAFLLLIKFLFEKSGGLITGSLMNRFIMDYIFTTVFIVVIGLIISSIMMNKKYFRYKTDGLRGIRSLQEVMFGVSGIILAIPFFMIG